ncbi:helix-turn-helix domain-containing protein [Lacticaseibacillus parakribbianus]|uniref:helix-turn-helix domain-containing protein n=1 Tax=Lacticaseibacillus parakribbianus TaxID=2970927 RepID=UPI0021CB90BA
MKFATQVRTYRQERGWSQEALAQQLFLTRQTISKWEQGDATPDLETLVRLATLFNVSLDRLVLGQATAPGSDATADRTQRPTPGPENTNRRPTSLTPKTGQTAYDWLEDNWYLGLVLVLWIYVFFH